MRAGDEIRRSCPNAPLATNGHMIQLYKICHVWWQATHWDRNKEKSRLNMASTIHCLIGLSCISLEAVAFICNPAWPISILFHVMVCLKKAYCIVPIHCLHLLQVEKFFEEFWCAGSELQCCVINTHEAKPIPSNHKKKQVKYIKQWSRILSNWTYQAPRAGTSRV